MAKDFLAASAVKNYNSAAAEPFLNGSSTAYVEEMYNAWLRDPASVHAVGLWFSWRLSISISLRTFIVKVARVEKVSV